MAKCTYSECRAELANPFVCRTCKCGFCSYQCLFASEVHSKFCGKLDPSHNSTPVQQNFPSAPQNVCAPHTPVQRALSSEGASIPVSKFFENAASRLSNTMPPQPKSSAKPLQISTDIPPPSLQPSLPCTSARSPPRMISPTGLAQDRRSHEREKIGRGIHRAESSRFVNYGRKEDWKANRNQNMPSQKEDNFTVKLEYSRFRQSGDFSEPRSRPSRGGYQGENRARPKSDGQVPKSINANDSGRTVPPDSPSIATSNNERRPARSLSGSDKINDNSNSPENLVTETCRVYCMYKDERGQLLWVVKESDSDTYNAIMTKLSNANLRMQPIPEPVVGEWYAIWHESEWTRCCICGIAPLSVFFMDYGNVECVKPENLRDLPQSLKEIPEMAHPLKLTDKAAQDKLELNMPFSVKVIGMEEENKVFIAEMIVVRPGVGRKQNSAINGLAVEPAKVTHVPVPAKPAEPSPVAVAANVPAEQPTSNKPVEVKAAAVRTVQAPAVVDPVQPEMTKVVGAAAGLRIPSQALVLIEIAYASNGVFISSNSEADLYCELNVAANNLCVGYAGSPAEKWDANVTGAPLLELPPVNAVVLAEFCGFFYRARVLLVQDDQVTVHFLDFGNESQLDRTQLRTLCKQQRELLPAVISVELIGVPNVPYKTVEDFFQKIIDNRTVFTLNYEGDGSNGVALNADETSLNDLLNDHIHTPKLDENDPAIIVDPDCYCVLPLSEGECKILVTYYSEDEANLVYCANMNDDVNDDIAYIFIELPRRLKECYADTVDPYMPHNRELCAVYAGKGWERAYCLSQGAQVAELFCIDTGVKATFSTNLIRPLQKDFKSKPAVANKCFIDGEVKPLVTQVMSAIVKKEGDGIFKVRFVQ